MNNDLRPLAALLAQPEPSRDTVARGRHALLAAIRGPVRGPRRRIGWLVTAGLAGTAAAATAVAVAVSSGTPAPSVGSTHHAATGSHPAHNSSGRQFLLAAATSALSASDRTGKYWYVKTTYTKKASTSAKPKLSVTYESWQLRHGPTWSRIDNGPVTENAKDVGFSVLAQDDLTFTQLQQLPTTPEGLRAWILTHSRRLKLHYGTANVYLLDAASALVTGVPAPAAVRAAAFKVLAGLPNVTDLGPVPGGRQLRISYAHSVDTLVVDTATGIVRNSTSVGHYGRGEVAAGQQISAGWTNARP